MIEKKPNPLDVVLAGCGRAGRRHLKAIDYYEKKGLVRLRALLDTDGAAALALLKERRAKQPVTIGLPEMLPETTPDLVIVATPPRFHAPMAKTALGMGAHVIVEKPMTLDLDEAADLVRLEQTTDRLIVPCLTYRYVPGVREIKSWLNAAPLGRLLSASVIVRWGHDQAYYDQAPWFGRWEEEGGAIVNQTIHALDLIFYLAGTMPSEVTAMLAPPYHRMEAADLGMGIFRLPDGALVSVEGSTVTDPARHEASFFMRYEKGTLRAGMCGRDVDFSVTPDRKAATETIRPVRRALGRLLRENGPSVLRHVGRAHTLLLGDVIQALRKGTAPAASAKDGLTSLQLVLTLLESAKTGCVKSFPTTSFSLAQMNTKD